MSSLYNEAIIGAAGQSSGYEIEQSLRFNDSDSAHLSATLGMGTRTAWTWSCWVKTTRSDGTAQAIFGSSPASSLYNDIGFDNGQFRFRQYHSSGGGNSWELKTTAVYRDFSAWYHIVLRFDTAQATNSDRVKIWINGNQVTSFAAETYPGQDIHSLINNQYEHGIGKLESTFDYLFDGYLAEMHFVDNDVTLTPTDFGEYDNNGVWRPIEYTGSHGTKGFYLKFDPSAANGIGHDHSGNGNHWTPSNLTTSGTGTDVMNDTPTKNWCTLNPLVKNNNLSDGNLVYNTATGETAYSTFGVSSGKWYCEVTCNNANTWFGIGTDPFLRLNSAASNQVLVGTGGGTVYSQNSTNTYDAGATWTTNDVIGIALDADNGGCIFYKNNTRILEWDSFTVDGPYFFGFDRENPSPTTTHPVNFGQRDFAYTPPTGYKALNTKNLPAPTIKDGSDYFNTVLYTGNATGRTITGVGFQADFLWNKLRDTGAQDHLLYDTVRGIGSNGNYVRLRSNTNTTEEDPATTNQDLTAFTSDGFTIGTHGALNGNNQAYVTWLWKAGGGSGSSNTDGSITSTVSANTTAGFSIVSYAGNATNNTVGHGLGVAPSMIICKKRNVEGGDWGVYHAGIGATKYLILNTSASQGTASTVWQDTSPTSTVFSIGTSSLVNQTSRNFIAYCFAEVEGYSKMGTYTGSTGYPFVYCGFRPAFILLKPYDLASGWYMYDSTRGEYNVVSMRVLAETADQETSAAGNDIDILSNGFKLRGASNSGSNYNGINYIFYAVAENPFGGSGTTPVTAR